MIELRNVAVRTRKTINPVSLTGLNVRIEDRERFALLAPSNGTLNLAVAVVCKSNAPDAGRVIQTSSLSWPIPSSAFLHKHQTFVANARFVARLYGVDQTSYIDRVVDMARITDLAEERISHCPKKAVSRFAFALGACLPFDFYLLTNTSIGEKEERETYAEMIAELGRRSGLIVATSNPKSAKSLCDRALVLDPAGSVTYDDMDAAVEHLERISKRVDESSDDMLAEEEERVFEDFF
jgi:capsular polysaccharide transport system ATP-binding protein